MNSVHLPHHFLRQFGLNNNHCTCKQCYCLERAAGRWEVTFSVYGFSGFFVKTHSSALPLTLLSFTGSKQNGYNKLQWVTADEVNTNTLPLNAIPMAGHLPK